MDKLYPGCLKLFNCITFTLERRDPLNVSGSRVNHLNRRLMALGFSLGICDHTEDEVGAIVIVGDVYSKADFTNQVEERCSC